MKLTAMILASLLLVSCTVAQAETLTPVMVRVSDTGAVLGFDLGAATAAVSSGGFEFAPKKWWNNNWKLITASTLVATAAGVGYAVYEHNSDGGSSSKAEGAVAVPDTMDASTTINGNIYSVSSGDNSPVSITITATTSGEGPATVQ
jgi:hypothetical protein